MKEEKRESLVYPRSPMKMREPGFALQLILSKVYSIVLNLKPFIIKFEQINHNLNFFGMFLAGRKRRALSEGIRAQVSGKPQVLGYRTDEMVWAPRDSDAVLDIIFCSNPKYKNVYWEWGEIPNIIQMREGKQRKKLNSNYFEKLILICRKYCLYIYR